MDNKINDIISLIQNSNNIAISGHLEADLDSIGSTLSMYEICLQLLSNAGFNKNIIPLVWEHSDILQSDLPYINELMVCNHPQDLENISFLRDIDLMIFVDVGKLSRSPLSKLIKENSKVIVIDHHLNSCVEDMDRIDIIINYVARSNTKIIYNEFLGSEKGINLSKSLAQNILAGIYGDTDFLTDTNIKSEDFRLIANLLDYGADLDNLIIKFKRSLSFNKLKAISSALSYVKSQNNYTYCVLDNNILTQIESETNYKLQKYDIINEIRCIDKIDFGIVIFEPRKNFLSASLKARTKKINLQEIARYFGGGGHKTASAFRFETDNFYESVKKILDFLDSLPQK